MMTTCGVFVGLLEFERVMCEDGEKFLGGRFVDVLRSLKIVARGSVYAVVLFPGPVVKAIILVFKAGHG